MLVILCKIGPYFFAVFVCTPYWRRYLRRQQTNDKDSSCWLGRAL